MLQKVSKRVCCWSEIHGATRNEPYPWNSYAVALPEESVLALVDPLPLSAGEVEELEQLGKPTHILLTCEYHIRSSEAYRDRWGCKILADTTEVDRYEIPLDGSLHHGEQLWDLVEVTQVPGAGRRRGDRSCPEVGLLVRDGEGVLILGDVLCGGRKDQGIPDGQIGLSGPEYVFDLNSARRGLRRLLDHSFEVLCFGHGTPVSEEPKARLRQFLDSDQSWELLEEMKRSRPVP